MIYLLCVVYGCTRFGVLLLWWWVAVCGLVVWLCGCFAGLWVYVFCFDDCLIVRFDVWLCVLILLFYASWGFWICYLFAVWIAVFVVCALRSSGWLVLDFWFLLFGFLLCLLLVGACFVVLFGVVFDVDDSGCVMRIVACWCLVVACWFGVCFLCGVYLFICLLVGGLICFDLYLVWLCLFCVVYLCGCFIYFVAVCILVLCYVFAGFLWVALWIYLLRWDCFVYSCWFRGWLFVLLWNLGLRVSFYYGCLFGLVCLSLIGLWLVFGFAF